MSEEFVTVVSVQDAPFVTVVEVQEPPAGMGAAEQQVCGDGQGEQQLGIYRLLGEDGSETCVAEEEVRIYRLPGERLGFGLKFDGGPTVSTLRVESTAEGSPSARARASWGRLSPGDSILEVDGKEVSGMTRQEVVSRLTESGLVVRLRVRREAPPVPPRRQAKRRLPGPPPPPRPLPRAPPRLVHFLPKDTTTQPHDSPQHSPIFKCNSSESQEDIEINGDQHLYHEKDVELEPQPEPVHLEDPLKDKIIPLRNLNPKLTSLFEHSQPTDNNFKTSQNVQFNNKNLWLNDDKSRKSVKDKIALFSLEAENQLKNDYKNHDRSDPGKRAPKKLHATLSVPELGSENVDFLCSRISISENGDFINGHESFEPVVAVKPANKPLILTVSPAKMESPKSEISCKETVTVNAVQTRNKTTMEAKNERKLEEPKQISTKVDSTKIPKHQTYIRASSISPEPKILKPTFSKEKSVSKLRGLVIPRTPSKIPSEQILDLPEIKSAALFSHPDLVNNKSDEENVSNEYFKDEITRQRLYSSTHEINQTAFPTGLELKTHFENELPKYSPAFKRKTLSVFEIRSNCGDNHYSKDVKTVDKSDTQWTAISSNQENIKQFSDNETKDKIEFQTKPQDKVLLEPVDKEIKSTKASESEVISNESVNATASKDIKNVQNNIEYGNPQDNHSENSSLASNCSRISGNMDLEKSKTYTEGLKHDSLSQDLSDSGNHSIPSNYSKSKCDSSDESISSLVNGEILDSDQTSLNSSSDEGHFIEFSYKTKETFEKNIPHKKEEDKENTLNPPAVIKESRLSKKCDIESFAPIISEIVKNEDKSVDSLDEDITDAKEIYSVEWSKSLEKPLSSNKSEYRDTNSEDLFTFKMPLIDKINLSTSAYLKRLDSKDYNIDISKDQFTDENISNLNSPVGDLQKENHFASITSLASSTSLISHQELCQLIEESNDSSMDDVNGSPEISVIVLHRDTAEGSIGIILAGGVDYESKDITVHKVLSGSPADRDGRIKKGHRILSINGKSMKGLTHAESLAVLKAPRHEVVLVVARSQSDIIEENNNLTRLSSQQPAEADNPTHYSALHNGEAAWGPTVVITLTKEGTGLGFSLRGGKDSPYGDQPLTIQKIFTGGCAEKSKKIFAGDELLSINEYDLKGMTRVEAWTLMKRLPDGQVSLKIRHQTHN